MNLAKIFHAALGDLALGSLVAAALPARGAERHVIAIGKAAPAMAAGALADHYLVIAPDGTPAEGLEIMRASHPVPDARSVRAGRACLVAAAAARGQLVVLVSGGASALACVPSEGVTLARKRAVTRTLLRSGASIQELNVVRKLLSLLKGGGLLRAARDASVLTLIASDIIGGTASEVGSGPSVPDPSTTAEARRILRRYAPDLAALPLTSKKPPPGRVDARIIASPELLAKAVAARLGVARVLPPSQATADELAAEYVKLARRAPMIYVRAAEPSVLVKGRAGRGGRSTHLATLVAAALPETRAVTFAAFASDGVDGLSGTAGAIIDHATAARARITLGENALAGAIARFDTGSLHRAIGTALREQPTGHNLADIHILVVS